MRLNQIFMSKKEKPTFEVIDTVLGRTSQTLYIIVEISSGEEIEFTRRMYEEQGNVIEYECYIEDDEQREIFENLDEDLQDEIEDYIHQIEY
jgi:hypothetical protein